MNPNHYCDIERCKKLTEIGFPRTQHTYSFGGDKCETEFTIVDEDDESVSRTEFYHCPSVMEMLDVIPKTIGGAYQLVMGENNVSYDNTTLVDRGYEYKGEFYDTRFPLASDTLPNALADLIFWLVENSYLTIGKSE